MASVQRPDIHAADKFLLLLPVIIHDTYQFCVDITKSCHLFPKCPLFNKPVKIIRCTEITVRHISDQPSRTHVVHNTEHIIIGAVSIPRDLIQIHLHIILYTVILYHSQRHIRDDSCSQKASHRTQHQYAKHLRSQCILFYTTRTHMPIPLPLCITSQNLLAHAVQQ